MNRYIKSELYRMLRMKGTYLFMLISSLLLVSANVVLAAVKLTEQSFPYATTDFAFSNVESNMMMILFLCIMVAVMVFNNEYNNHTMKNSISFGITRSTLYFGKFFVQIIYALTAFIVIIGIEILSAYLLLSNSGTDSLMLLLKTCFLCLPIFFLGLALTNCFAFIFEGTGATVSASIGVLLAVPLVTNLLGMKFKLFHKISDIMPFNMVNSIDINFKEHSLTTIWGLDSYRNYWFIGILEMLVFIAIGYFAFKKREVK